MLIAFINNEINRKKLGSKMPHLISIETASNRLLFDLDDVTYMAYSGSTLKIRHINEPGLPTYQLDNLSQDQFDDILDDVRGILSYEPIGNMSADGAISIFLLKILKRLW